MRAYLHPEFRLSETKLLDTYLSSSYGLTPDTVWLIKMLERQPEIMGLTSLVVKKKHLPRAEAHSAVYELLSQLIVLGAVVLEPARSSWSWWFVHWLRQRRRYKPGVWRCIRAVGRAYGLICATLCLPYVALRLGSGVETHFALFMLVPVMLFGSFVLHEIGHMLAARQVQARAVVIAGFGYVAVMYSPNGNKYRRYIALAGPLCVAIACCAISLVLQQTFLQILLLGVGCLHMLHLLPFSADGKALWRKNETN